jgi:hypothetical protein
MKIGAIAVDPIYPQIVYFLSHEKGIFKSLDSGISWFKFTGIIKHATLNNLVIRYSTDGSGDVIIYAGTKNGLWRYRGRNPKAKRSDDIQWDQIKNGHIIGNSMAVHPTNNSILYVSVEKKGLWRTKNGENMPSVDPKDPNKGWTELKINNGVAGTEKHVVDIYRNNPKILFAAVQSPPGHEEKTGIYKSPDEGDSWDPMKYGKQDPSLIFIRVHPSDPRIVYHGYSGGWLFKEYFGVKINREYPESIKVSTGIHMDMKEMQFDPFDDQFYYILNDGGIWHCKVEKFTRDDNCKSRNSNLRVTQFYDFDASPTNPKLMIGGTQDVYTIRWDGYYITFTDPLTGDDITFQNTGWKSIRGGDGLYSLIGPNSDDKIMYSQEQYFCQTERAGPEDFEKLPKEALFKRENRIGENIGYPCNKEDMDLWGKHGYGQKGAYITVHPTDPNYLVALRWFTKDGGKTWHQYGYRYGSSLNIKHVIFQPGTNYWFMGTADGQIKISDGVKVPMPAITTIWQHDDKAEVTSMAFAPTNSNVLYILFHHRVKKKYKRIVRLDLIDIDPNRSDQNQNVRSTYIGQGLPNLGLKVISGDGHNENIAYVGTDKGVYQRVTAGILAWWRPYIDGFPLVPVKDMLVDPSSKELRAATWGRGAWSVITGP